MTVSTDVEMKNASSPAAEKDKEKTKVDVDAQSIQEIKDQIKQIEKAVQTKEQRFVLRVLRALPNTRRKLTVPVLKSLISDSSLNSFLEDEMETDDPSGSSQPSSKSGKVLPEVDAYIHLLVLVRLIDNKRYEDAVICSNKLMSKITSENRRTSDLIAAKCYFYHSRVHELTNNLDKVRSFLNARLRIATLRNDFEGQAVLINCLLRNYLHYNLYDQADKLVKKSAFPENASNNEWARFHFYLGRIKAVRLEYSTAHKNLVQALRKAPQTAAVGFRQTTQKLAVVVELLLGDIPDRQIFRQAVLRRALSPYFQLTQAVRMGELQKFNEVLTTYGNQFRTDYTFKLILRLRHNVIKTAIRSIGASYSRITPAKI
ncbi:probable 26S proteasome non-ATPase regulatory subunit 3 [Diaphorina citri]|uniref:Probable 26S proteasome non-ATPase regulatory subunit 3 n=1 Tax=Diaphorina citri TaxID=121845 RepID=A0A1S4ED50_DIACI|nr:probable 26S proteasome non-ATPase regulatory subunit 3 [Diaphorina citri]